MCTASRFAKRRRGPGAYGCLGGRDGHERPEQPAGANNKLRRYPPFEGVGEGDRQSSMTWDLPNLIRTNPEVVRSHAMPPSPSMRYLLPRPLTEMQHEVPGHLRRPFVKEQQRIILRSQMTFLAPTTDYWVNCHRRCSGTMSSSCGTTSASSSLAQDQKASLPGGLTMEWLTGVRATQAFTCTTRCHPPIDNVLRQHRQWYLHILEILILV